MKFMEMKHHNNDVHNSGERVLLCHGALAFYYAQVYIEPDVYDMRQYTMYIYHINTLDNKQDTACVLSIIKVILNCIKTILPHTTTLILHSDNTISYQNSIVPFFINMLRILTGIFVSCYIYTEIENIKCMIGGNFMEMTKIVHVYVDNIFNI